jgi:hypothetical protein
MRIKLFISKLQAEVNSAIAKRWISASDFSSHESSRRSILHSKMIGLISYTLQDKLGYYVQHETRPWGQFKPDIVAFKLSRGKPVCEGLIEYESPNSYLDTTYSHIGKDLTHYFEFHSEGDDDWEKYLEKHTPKVWLIITSLPDRTIDIANWKWIPRNWTAKQRRLFARNPQRFMYKKYGLRLSQMNSRRKLKLNRIPLFFYNIAQAQKNKMKIRRCLSSMERQKHR